MSPIDAHDDYNKGRFPRGLGRLLFVANAQTILACGGRCVQGGWCPVLELFPYVPRFQPERFADGHEGEKTAKIIAEKPLLSLLRALTKPLIRLKLFIKAEKSIFEHSVHQRRLRAHGSEFDSRVEELFRKHAAAGGPLISAGPAGDQRLA
jgi:hypothetical protein